MQLEREIQADRAERVLAPASADALAPLFPAMAGALVHELTWRTAASLEQDMAWRCNGWLRRHGLLPSSPAPPPHLPQIKAGAPRLLDRLGIA